MSFGWLICFYGIGYAACVVASTCVATAWLVWRYRGAFLTVYLDYMSSPGHRTWVGFLTGTVCGMLFWPFVVPRRAIQLVREVNETAKKYNL